MNLPTKSAALALSLLLAACSGGGSAKEEDHDHAEGTAQHEEAEAAHGEETAVQHTRIPAAIAAESGIEVAAAAGGNIADEHEVQGLLTPAGGALRWPQGRIFVTSSAMRRG